MKTIGKASLSAVLLLTMFAPGGWAAGSENNSVRWETIVGTFFIGATPGTSGNTVGGITGGGEPWSALGGHAYVDLTDGVVDFEVRGLVLAGGNSIGTPATITQVKGALVCSPASSPQVFYTPPVPLSAQGNAEFDGSFTSSTADCSASNVVFLITTTASPPHWIANGAVRAP